MILRSCSFKILQGIKFHEELWLPWQQSEKTLKIFLSKPYGLERSTPGQTYSTKILHIMALEWKLVLCCGESDFI